MRINNRRSKKFVSTLYFVFAVSFVFANLSSSTVRSILGITKNRYTIMFAVLVLVLLFAHKVSKYFEYDSEGNVLVFVNRGMLLSDILNYREKRAEFPKKKLLYYKLNNYGIYKSLNVYVKSGPSRQKRSKFNVTLLSNKKIKYLRQSLDKVIRQNKTEG